MSLHRSECKGYLRLSQKGLAEKIVKTLPKEEGDRHQYHSPACDDIFSTPVHDKAELLSEKDRREFLSMLMTLMYLARLTRPDILLAVTHLASKAHCATVSDRTHLKRVIWYLDKTLDLGVYIHCTELSYHCHCDASHVAHDLKGSGRGHTGYVISMGPEHSYVHARSGKQKIATNSSTEAEVVALVEALKLRHVLTELAVAQLAPISVYEDNQSSIIMVETLNSPNNNSRHFICRVGYLHDLWKAGILKMIYLATELMTADTLTKPQHGRVFKQHIVSMMGLKWFNKFEAALRAELKRTGKILTAED